MVGPQIVEAGKRVDMNKLQVCPGRKRMARSKDVMGNQKTVSSWKGR
jgi:hypothetical protein